MAQIMVDTASDDASTMREIACLLFSLADIKDPKGAQDLKDDIAPAPAPKIEEKTLPFVKPPEAPSAPASSASTSASNVLTNPAPPPPPSLVKIPEPPSSPIAPNAAATSPAGATTQSSAGPVEYDSAGVPWDARIHQKTKGVKKDHTWKLLKGIDQNIVQGVIAELSANGKLKPTMPAAPTAQPVQRVPVLIGPNAGQLSESVFGKSPLPAGAEAPPPPPANNAPPPPPPSDAQPGTAFRTLVGRFAMATKAGHMTPQQLNALCQANGAPNIMALNSMEHLIPAVNVALDGELLSRGVTL